MSSARSEMEKSFTEIRMKMIEGNQKLKIVKSQIESTQMDVLRSKLTHDSLSPLDVSTVTYESFGRCFLQSDLNKIKTELKKREKESAEKLKNLENTKTMLERSHQDNENSFRELAQQWKNKQDG